MPKPLPNQQITETPELPSTGPRLVEPASARPRETECGASETLAEWKSVAGERLEDLKERSSEALSEVRQSAAEAYDQLKEKASVTLEQARARSAEMAHEARVRARGVVENYPLHFLAAVAGVAFVAGVLLRIWRSSRYE